MNHDPACHQQLHTELETLRRRVAELEASEQRCSKSREDIRANEQRFRAIFNSTFQFIGLLNPDGTMLEVNQTALDFGGLQPEEVIGKKFWDCRWWSISQEARSNLQDAVERAARGEFIRYEVEVQGAGDTTAVVDFTLKPVFDDAGRVVMLVPEGRDITLQKRTESDLQRHREHLEELVAERAVQLTESEARIRAILETVLDGIITIDARGAILSFNPAAAKLFGYESDEVIGKNVNMLMPEPYHQEHDRYLQRYLGTGERRIIGIGREVTGLRKDGSTFPLELSVSESVVNGEHFFTGVVRDLTARKAAEESIRNLATVVQETDNMVVITDARGYVEWVNPSFTTVTGYTLDEIKGQKPGHLLQGDETNRETERRVSRAIKEGRGIRVELLNYAKSGRTYWIDLNIQPVFDAEGRLEKYISIESDITERIRARESLQQAKEAAETANRAKSEFLANMSHEIRTPLNAVIGFSELALTTELTARQQDYLQKIRNSGQSLLSLINDILDFSKIEAGKLELEHTEFSLEELLGRIIPVIQHQALKKEIEFLVSPAPDLPQRLIGDPLRLGQILLNLLTNAVKFTERGEVELSVDRADNTGTGHLLTFTVRDTGIGMTSDQVQRLFQPFTQADGSTTRRFGGTGLGLSICRRLVDLMGGTITLASTIGVGSTFSITLPLGRAAASQSTLPLPPEAHGLRVLVVDDSLVSRKSLLRLLEALPVQAEAVDSGLAALQLIAARDRHLPYQLVLMDWRMADMDGIEATRRIRQNPDLNNRPGIIVVTAFGDEEERRAAAEAGADGFMLKPLTVADLQEIIIGLFGTDARELQYKGTHERRYDLSGLNLLLAEDNELNQQIARELLEEAGASVTVVDNGAEALSLVMAPDQRFDLLLMDIQMPVMDGLEACRRIRENARFRDLPIIALTAHAFAEERQRSREAGMNDHIVKPIDRQELLAAIARQFPHLPAPAAPPAAQAVAGSGKIPPAIAAKLDTDAALRRLGGNESLYLSILEKFGKGQHATAALVDAALATGAVADALQAVHTVKGLAGNIGALSLQSLAAELEAALRAGTEPERLELLHRQFSDEFAHVLSIVGQAGDHGGQEDARHRETSSGLSDTEQETVHHLVTLVRESDSTASDHLDLHRSLFRTLFSPDDLSRLEQQIAAYDFDEAGETLHALLARSDIAAPADMPGDAS